MPNFSTGLKKAIAGNGVDEASFLTLMENAVIGLYDGLVMPASADAAETGNLLGYVTLGGLAFTPGQPDGGLNFEVNASGRLVRPTDDEWSCVPILGGTVKYLRLYDNARILGASTTAKRIDFSAGITTGDARFVNLLLVAGSKIYARDISFDLFA